MAACPTGRCREWAPCSTCVAASLKKLGAVKPMENPYLPAGYRERLEAAAQ